MSIISAILTEKAFVIVTDSIAINAGPSGKSQFPPIYSGTTSKIQQYPHLKCCVVILGHTMAAIKHFEFIESNFFTDISELYEATKGKFAAGLNNDDYLMDDPLIAHISILGFSELEDRLVAYSVNIYKDKEPQAKEYDLKAGSPFTTLMHPRLSNEDEDEVIRENSEGGFSVMRYAVEVAKRMHTNSLSRDNPDKHYITVGGELHLTLVTAEEQEYMVTSKVAYRFPDFEDNIQSIKKYRSEIETNELPVRNNSEKLKGTLNKLLQNDDFNMVSNSFDMATIDFNAQMLITLQNNIIKDLHAFASKLIDQAAGSDLKSPL